MISKALLPTNLCAIDFKATLDDWSVPSRLIENATFGPMYVRVDIFDVRFMEEIK